MEKPEKMKLTNANQFEKLVEELQKNPTLAVGFRRGTVPSDFKEKWEKIATTLNAFGPPRRFGDGWQKVWRDLKFKVKKKMVTDKAECTATGGGVLKQCTFSPLEEAVANLLQFKKQMNPEGFVQGVQLNEVSNELEEAEHALDIKMEMPENPQHAIISEIPENPYLVTINKSTSSELIQSSTSSQQESYSTPPKITNPNGKKKCRCNTHSELLNKHSTEQAKLLTEISNSISSVKRSFKDVYKHQKQLLEFEEKKIKLFEEKIQIDKERIKIDKERNKREEEIHECDLKIKRMKLLIKEKELQLLNKRLE